MQFKVFFLLCALQAVQFASARCCGGPIVAPVHGCNRGCGYGAYNNGNFAGAGFLTGHNAYRGIHGNQLGYLGNAGWLNNGCHGHAAPGEIEAAGTLGVCGPVDVDGVVPVEGSVNYGGNVGAAGVACAACSCGNLWNSGYHY